MQNYIDFDHLRHYKNKLYCVKQTKKEIVENDDVIKREFISLPKEIQCEISVVRNEFSTLCVIFVINSFTITRILCVHPSINVRTHASMDA